MISTQTSNSLTDSGKGHSYAGYYSICSQGNIAEKLRLSYCHAMHNTHAPEPNQWFLKSLAKHVGWKRS